MRPIWSTILLAGALFCAPVLAWIGPADAQQVEATAPTFRVFDQDRLFRQSVMGQQIIANIERARQALEAENQIVFDQLAAEERELTDLRPTLDPETFRARADAFDAHVEEVRAERAAASQELERQSVEQAQSLFDAVLPILDQLMAEQSIIAILRPESLILTSENLDITDIVIERLDAITPEPAR